MLDLLRQSWPWYVAGPLIGLTVSALLLIGNKSLGISNSLRHVCAACLPAGIPFLNYNWRAESWNLFFVMGITIGGFLGYRVLGHPDAAAISAATVRDLKAQLHLTDFSGLLPRELFALDNLGSWRGWMFLVLGWGLARATRAAARRGTPFRACRTCNGCRWWPLPAFL